MFPRRRRTFYFKNGIGALWCSLMHDSPRWPIHGHYACGVCGRQYRVPWTETQLAGGFRVRRAPLPSLPSAILPVLLLMAAVAWPSRGAETTPPESSSAAAAVLQRFIAGQGEAAGWTSETIEIEASLPKLKKTGRLRAIRTIFPMGRRDYQVLESAGDPTVKNQVIVRYLSADEKTAETPAASVALTPANYKIRYAGTVRLGDRRAYAFRVVPRKKRVGLINGVLWLDAQTGIALRETGYLAKSPSVFLKRINLTRENELEQGSVRTRITHISIETRLVGRAQLVVVEHSPSFPLTARRAAVGEQ